MTIDYIALLPTGFTDDPERGPVYVSAPSEVDDLTQIHGIGSVLESQLNLNGVYRLEQIASWDQTNIEAFSSLMPCFQDRIERNYWILQAQRIIERRYVAEPIVASPAGFPAGVIQTVLMLAMALLVGLLFVQWMAGGTPTTYAGQLKARAFHVVATQAGTVSELAVLEGDQVLEGQQVATLHDSALNQTRRRQQTLVASLQKAVEEAEAKADLDLKWRIYELDKEIIEHRQAIAIASEPPPPPPVLEKPSPIIESSAPTKTASFSQKSRAPLFFSGRRRTVQKNEIPVHRATQQKQAPLTVPPVQEPIDDPFTAGYEEPGRLKTAARPPVLQQISGVQELNVRPVAMPRPVVMSLADKIKLAEERIEVLMDLKRSLRENVKRAGGLITAKASLNEAEQHLKSLEDTANDVVITTTGFGIVSKVLCEPGEQVRPGQPVLELIDSRSQHVTALVPSKHIDSIKPGMKVTLYFPGDQRRRGRINSLPVRTTELDAAGEPMVEVRVEPMGGLWPAIPIGSEVRVSLD